MVVLSTQLTTEQVTLIIRAIVQALSYGIPFLLGLVILGNAPKVAPLETHDLLNRVVGQSTSFFASCRWILKRLFRENRDPISSIPLLYVLILSLCFGWFVSLSDLGLLGVVTCTVPGEGPSFQDFPASIKSDADALAAVTANMLNGTDPNTVKAYRCSASADFKLTPTFPSVRTCSEWSNSTYGNSSHFSLLNSTDSEVLMPRGYFARDYFDYNGTSDLNMYFRGASGSIVTEPTIQSGIAVLPHDTGVRLIVGVPQLSKNQKVDIPKTLGLEVEIGCMSLGIVGEDDDLADFPLGQEYFIPNSTYLPERLYSYSGPEYLQGVLADAADAVRTFTMDYFNTSTISSNGFHPSFNGSGTVFSPITQISGWVPPGTFLTDAQLANIESYFVNNTSRALVECGVSLGIFLNVTFPPRSLNSTIAGCQLHQIKGSYLRSGVPTFGHASMICGATSQVNMLSATLETDGDGALTYNFTRIRSTLNIVAANLFEILNDAPQVGYIEEIFYDNMWRFTLSDNPEGPSQHYIYQEWTTRPTAELFSRGSGSTGVALAQVGSAILNYGTNGIIDSVGILNSQYFTSNLSALEVTRWASGFGASYLLSSVGYNGWAARGSKSLTVINTGGKLATCYNLQYAAAFVPLVAAALVVVIWGVVMLFNSMIEKANKLEELYGGLSTVIEFPYPGGLPSYTYLEWEDHPQPHLKPAVEGLDASYFELRKLVGHGETDNEA